MTDNVVEFPFKLVGENAELDPDEMLENNKGQNFKTLCIIGELEDGELYVASSVNLGKTLVLLFRFQHQLATGESS